ncbi:hypothetical protein [Diaminobutyricimonas sp. LJ205]|uniref:hypothetical protein n=1 Tax=Diaminobutyricimonas sp. LJ205 TaxID=2683590 RepID=UPI0012F49D4B|nr:hypothetical protein [Diaminobutyricimonas sp. LJ205]
MLASRIADAIPLAPARIETHVTPHPYPQRCSCQTMKGMGNMSEPQVWVLIGVFAAAIFAVLGVMTTMFSVTLRASLREVNSSIGGLREVMDARFARMDERFNATDAKFESRFQAMDAKLENRFEAMDAKFEGLRTEVNGNFAAIDTKVDSIDRRVDSIDKRLDNLDRDVQILTKRAFGTDV